MSINLGLSATTSCTLLLSYGEKLDKINHTFTLWQTPTEVTEEAIKSSNPLKFYKDWATGNIDADDTDILNYHLQNLDKWFDDHDGWKITWYSE